MKNVLVGINGGAAVRITKYNPGMIRLAALVVLLLLTASSSAFAQGSIFGSVQNSDAGVPANGEITFYGFLDDTDEEIRIETSDGAGYDAGNWFDDFQNYLTEGPGNPYDYYFYNVANAEGYHLAALIPANSFQQEDILLAANAWPVQPAGFAGTTVSSSAVLLTWNGTLGLTYHVYRRSAASNGSFFRIDNVAGDLADRGVADSFFVDITADGASSYDYLIIAEDGSGNLSPHSALITVNSATVAAPALASLDPNHGTIVGGTAVTITGSGFDPAGATVQFGTSSPVSATVVSPYTLTVDAPAGPAGPADVVVTNTASGLTSNTLTGGYTYDANTPPVLAVIGPQSITEGGLMSFVVSATDVDGDFPVMTSTALPGIATYTDNGDGTGSFSWQTTFVDANVYSVTFYATDAVVPAQVDSEVVTITVVEAGNQTPVLAAIADASVPEGGNLNFIVSASDVDETIPALSAVNLPANATFVDNADGTGTFDFNPDLTQEGLFTVTFIADDGTAADSQDVQITVTGTNQAPVLAAIVDTNVTEGENLNFVVTGSDPDATIPALSAINLPANATFVDNTDGTGGFDFNPDFTQAGPITITFIADDGVLADSQDVVVTVIDAGNQGPTLAVIADTAVSEGGALSLTVAASDPDGTIPVLSAIDLPANATFVDNTDGTGVFDFNPDMTQEGAYTVTFIADDGTLADSQAVLITVVGTNQVPVIAPVPDTSVAEGDTLILAITATDADGVIPVLTAENLPANATFVDNTDGTGTFEFLPDFTQAGAVTVSFIAGDGVAADTQDVVITVTDAGDQVPILTLIADTTINEGDTLALTVAAIDPDGVIPTLTAENLPTNATFIDNTDGTGAFEFVPDYTQTGAYTVTFIASDGTLADTMDVLITVNDLGNLAPVFAVQADTAVNEGDVLVLNVSAIDPDGAGAFPTMSLTTGMPNYTFVDNGDGTGTFTYSPSFLDADTNTVTFFAVDEGTPQQTGVLVVEIITFDVNQAPDFEPVGPFGITLGETLEFTVAATDSTDPDVSHQLLLSLLTPLANATFVDNNDGTGTFTFTPDDTQVSLHTMRFLVVDQGSPAMSRTMDVDITVVTANIAPIFDIPAGQDQITEEGVTLSFGVTASDPDGGIPVLTARNLPDNSSFADNGDGTGTFTFTPDFTQGGRIENAQLYWVEFRAYDGFVISKETVIFQVVDAGNQAPEFDPLPQDSVVEGESVVVSVTASDPDGELDTLTMTVTDITVPENATFADSGNGLCTIEFSPDYTQSGDYDIEITVSDGSLEAVATVRIVVVDAGPQPPALNPIADASVTELVNLNFDVSTTDPDEVPPTLSTSALPGAATFTDNGDFTGTFDWTPSDEDAGTYLIWFYATDIDDIALIDSLQVQILVADTNRPPRARAFSATIDNPDPLADDKLYESGTLTQQIVAWDPDGDIPELFCYLDGEDSLATNMTFTYPTEIRNDSAWGEFTFTPDYDQGIPVTGQYYAWRYKATYENADTLFWVATQQTVFVHDRNQPPYMMFYPSEGPFSILEGEAVEFIVAGFDPDGATVPTVAAFDLPANSSVTGDTDSLRFLFTPDFTQAGVYTVGFTVTDIGGAADTSLVMITVNEAGNQAPLFVTSLDSTTTTPAATGLEVIVRALDPEHGAVTITADPILDGATFHDNGDGTATYFYSPPPDVVDSSLQVTFVVTDVEGMTDSLVTWFHVVNFLRGDLDLNSKYTMNDLAYLIGYLYREGPEPNTMDVADVNDDTDVNLIDVAYLIRFFYFSGPRPPQ